MQQIAEVADAARQETGYPELPRRARRVEAPQRVEVIGQSALVAPAEIELAVGPQGFSGAEARGEPGQRLTEIPDVERGNTAPGNGRQRVHGPARDASEPRGAESAVAVEQRGAHDAPVGAAGAERLLARELRTEEAAPRPRIEAQRRDVNQRQPALPAGAGQRGRGLRVDSLVGLATALAEDADRVDDDVDAVEQIEPVESRKEPLEADAPARAALRFRRQSMIDAPGMPAADDGPAAQVQQGAHRMPADEARGAEDEHDGPRSRALGIGAAAGRGLHRTLLRFPIFLS